MRNLLFALVAPALLAAAPADVPSRAAPLFFTANRGQLPPRVRFMAQGSGLEVYFARQEIVFRGAGAVVRAALLDSEPGVRIEGIDRLAGEANFLIGEQSEWRLGVPVYAGVVYRGLYPGIDMVYRGEGRDMKSEFVVAPEADPAHIRIRYRGGEVRVDRNGELVVAVHGHELRERAPDIYQEVEGRRVPVEGSFVVDSGGAVGFIVNRYDRSLPLIIDPVLSYSTLLGGSNADAAMGLAVDSTGAAYIAGFTASRDFPTANPEQNSEAGSNDVFVAKLNSAGNGVVYATYIGGSGDDRANALAVDSSGSVYVTGSTTSTNFPLRNAAQAKSAGGKDAFVLKLNSQGNALVYGTYLGGSSTDAANGLALDNSGNAYVAGDTTSINFPATGLQRSNHGGQDAFTVKLTAAGAVAYSTFLGGESDDHAAAIAVDASGLAVLTGSTYSTAFPTAGAVQNTLAGGQDAFVTGLSADGGSLRFSRYLGGTSGTLGSPESGQGIALDAQGNIFLAGVTSSNDFPLLHPAQSSRRGGLEAFAARLSASGVLDYSTFLGGTGADTANAITVDAAGNAYIAGQTYSTDLSTVNAFQSTNGGSYDAFLAKLNPAGDTVLSLSYLGGSGADTATSIALDADGSIYLAGWTLSTNFPVVNGYQSTNAGNYGAFVTKIVLGSLPSLLGVSPNSGSGASQTFSIQISDSAGVSNLTTVSLILNSTASPVSACAVTYTVGANSLMLLTDAGAAPGTSITPGSGSQQNSQCTLNGVGSSVSTAGNTLTLNLALAFQAAFSGTWNIYLQAVTPSGTTGWQQSGSWTVPASGPPATVSVTPGSGTGTTQTFAFTYSDSRGYGSIVMAQVLINTSFATPNGCFLYFNRSANSVFLTNDAGTSWQGPVTLGTSGTLQNSQCTVSGSGSSATGTGNTLTLNLALTFKSAFAGSKKIYMEVNDATGDSGWQQRGTWTVPASLLPSTISVSPSSGSGTTQTFAFTFSDPSGYASVVAAQMLFNTSFATPSSCFLYLNRAASAIYLASDAGTVWQGPVTLGTSGTLQNSQCTLSGAGSSLSGSGTTLTLNVALTFKGAFSGSRNIYMEVANATGDSGWQQRGTWTVPASLLPSTVSVSPSSGSGKIQTFAFSFSDPSGYASIVSTQMLFNTSFATPNGCFLYFNRANNSIYLTNDAATSWQSPVTLGSAGTLQNSQCTVTASTSSATGTGNTLTLNLALSFKITFTGAKNVYMEAANGAGDSGWQQRGTWTVP